ncbi:MAG: hypothetical protein IJN67_13285 [Oscillospiraceae bacterium]|nr:hypothetical protein [Oscillospiraceae bacterium]
MKETLGSIADKMMKNMADEEIKKAAKIGIMLSLKITEKTIKEIQETRKHGKEK